MSEPASEPHDAEPDVAAADASYREEFIERFADYWTFEGASRAEGRIAAYLLLDEGAGATAEQIARDVGLSRGAVSMITRRLVAAGFIRKTRPPGQRVTRHRMSLDVWGDFLEHHHAYLNAQRQLAEETLEKVPEGTPAHTRLLNMRDYMTWLTDGMQLRQQWELFKTQRDGGSPG